jgi:hypothetical protein
MRSIALFLAISGHLSAQDGPLMKALLPRLQTARLNLVEAAKLMPEADYGYRLTPAQRTFGQWIEHTIEMNFGTCASLYSTPGPDPLKYKESTAKKVLVSDLDASMEYCEQGFRAMTDRQAMLPKASGKREVYPVSVMIGLVVNLNEHYGNLVGYLRTKGFTPPSTARAQRAKK